MDRETMARLDKQTGEGVGTTEKSEDRSMSTVASSTVDTCREVNYFCPWGYFAIFEIGCCLQRSVRFRTPGPKCPAN